MGRKRKKQEVGAISTPARALCWTSHSPSSMRGCCGKDAQLPAWEWY